jgi:hypothetical protein
VPLERWRRPAVDKGFLGASLALERDNVAIPDSTGFLS